MGKLVEGERDVGAGEGALVEGELVVGALVEGALVVGKAVVGFAMGIIVGDEESVDGAFVGVVA